MNNHELESFIEKFLFLNFHSSYNMDESLLFYLKENSLEIIKEDTYKLRLYLKHKQISKKRKNILLLCCVPGDFATKKMTPIQWAEDWLLFNLDKYIEENENL